MKVKTMIAPFIQGFGTGGGLIVAIGAQNAFVLSQGVRRNHHLIIALICIICDAVFISAGVAGFGGAVSNHPTLSQWVTWGGAVIESRHYHYPGRHPAQPAFLFRYCYSPGRREQPVSRGKPAIFLDWGRFRLHSMVYQPEPWGANACSPV